MLEPKATDYRLLLMKYINHVGDTEGITFVDGENWSCGRLTDEEWAELQALDEEAATLETREEKAARLEYWRVENLRKLRAVPIDNDQQHADTED